MGRTSPAEGKEPGLWPAVRVERTYLACKAPSYRQWGALPYSGPNRLAGKGGRRARFGVRR
jgi:hypothetical protein